MSGVVTRFSDAEESEDEHDVPPLEEVTEDLAPPLLYKTEDNFLDFFKKIMLMIMFMMDKLGNK